MIGKSRKINLAEVTAYREEPVKPAVYAMLVIVIAVAAPLAWWNHKIGEEGIKTSDTMRYQNMVAAVSQDMKTVQRLLESEHVDASELNNVKSVKLITPDVSAPKGSAPDPDAGKFKITITGIYWSPQDPVATINGEIYHVGGLIQGHRIIEIRKTAVIFEDPLGDKVVKNFYDDIVKKK